MNPLTCPECGATYWPNGGGHCRGGRYGGCCRTFTSSSAAEWHLVKDDRGEWMCVDVTDDRRVRRDGSTWTVPWRLTARGWTPFAMRDMTAVGGDD